MSFCLTIDQENKLRDALVSGKLDPFKLAEMSSEERRAVFEKFIDAENAENVNSLFESKLLLKNQVQGFKTWAKSLVGVTPKVKRDLLTKIDRLSELGVLDPADLKVFREDLVRIRLGFAVTFEEAKVINELSAERVEAKDIWEAEVRENPEWVEDPAGTRKEWINDTKRYEYGLKNVALKKFTDDIKFRAKKERVDFRKEPVPFMADEVKKSPKFFNGLLKALGATGDNSFWGRQGLPNLYGTPAQKRIWARNFAKSFSDIAGELRKKKVKGVEIMDMVHADISSRPSAMSGEYKAGDYRLNVEHEEVIPTSLPEKIPGLGRLFRASETAFSGGALRMRADLADMLISQMRAQGINTLDKKNAIPAGHFVGSLTGRGNLGKGERIGEELNMLLWSARFFKANVEKTFAPAKFAATKLGLRTPKSEGAAFIEKKAAQNTLSMVGHVAGLMMLAGFLDPESFESDPRSTNFGRIKIFGHWVDVTGGMRTIVTLAARIVPTVHNGTLGFWSKSSTGKWTNLTSGEFGARDGVDVLVDTLLLNRLAPLAEMLRDVLRGEMFGGEPFDIQKSITNSSVPFSIQTVNDLKDEAFAAVFSLGILEHFGLGVSTHKFQSNWERSTSEEMRKFKEQVGEDVFKDANDSYNRAYNAWYEAVQEDSNYQELSEEGKRKLESQARSAIKKRILDEYGYDDTKEPETVEELKEKEKIKLLKPVSQAPESSLVNLVEKLHDKIVPDVMAAETWTREDWEKAMNQKKPSFFEAVRSSIKRLFGETVFISPGGEVVKGEVKGIETEVVPTTMPTSTPTPELIKSEYRNQSAGSAVKNNQVSVNAIKKNANKYKVPVDLATDIAFAESSLDYRKGSKESSAAGLFQYINSTWNEMIKRGLITKDDSKTDPEINARLSLYLISHRELSRWNESLHNWGRYYTPKELLRYYGVNYFPPKEKWPENWAKEDVEKAIKGR